jgi:glycine betaine catabolism B
MWFESEVIDVVNRAESVRSVRFAKPEAFEYLAGQWVLFSLGEGGLTKPLSLSSSPTEGFLEVTKRLTGHPFANALSALKARDVVKISPARGNLTLPGGRSKLAMLAGGIGITPMRSMIKYATDKKLDADIVLLYSCNNENDTAFGDELQEMAGKNSNLKVAETVTKPGPGWKGATGRIDKEMIERDVPDFLERTFYISGPDVMVKAMVLLLGEMKVPGEQVKRETFVGYD